jgi:RNA polymerase sigma-70 factor (ECF subfamily)
MADQPDGQPDDLTVALQIMEGDRDGLRTLIRMHGPRVKGFLRKRFGDVLDDSELEEAFCRTVERAWRYAARFDDRKGTLAAWLIRIARNCAVSILTRERERDEHEREYDPKYDPAEDPSLSQVAEEPDTDPRTTQRLLKDLEDVIRKLPPLQQAIVRADLACSDEKADSQRLADQHGSTKNSIEVSRNKARATIEAELVKRGHFQDQQRAKK